MTTVLIDTDPGIDDALALLLAWGSHGVEVEAITTVAGNVAVERGTTNVFRLLALRRPQPRPAVAVGAARPLARPLQTAARYHGEDGLGDLDDWPPVTLAPISQSAAGLIAETARRLGERLTLVALGPLTNLALALAADRAALAGVDRVVVMGGAVDVPGNVTPTAEFNMHVDPDAAGRVFTADLPIDLVPLDATRQATLARADLEAALAKTPGPLASRIAAFTRRAFRLDGGAMYLHDPLAVAAAADPTLVEWEEARLEIGPDGATRRAAGASNCRVAARVDRPRFLATFLERLCPGSS
ncbi:MAG TPA: nucleoside hydrolase [Methylomirabilota bacterium]|jgi:inosine-uridine nucleoside N-ribohydrolase|nr:nucleoside hydrolase [Methylomirabilota bacterium]